MLQLSYLREHADEAIRRLRIKNFDGAELIRQILVLDDQRRETQKQNDDLLSKSNRVAKEIGNLFKAGKTAEANAMKAQSTEHKEQSKILGVRLTEIIGQIDELLLKIPNLPHETVAPGKGTEENTLILSEGKAVPAPSGARPHWELSTTYDLIDFNTGTKITGAGFPLYKGKGARLQRALVNFFLDEAVLAGYEEVQPPYLVNTPSAYGTGQLPDKEGQMYHVPLDDLYLIPTAEVPVTNIYRDMILPTDRLPVRNVAYSGCFRREAGSWGKDVRGLNRLHQFDKVEIVQISRPDHSYQILEEMCSHVAGLLRKLGLPFRIIRLCGGDMSFAAAMTYDFEVWSSAQERWLEVSSVSNFESFQSNRMKLRFRDDQGKVQLAHTLNGSALALPRIVAALLENNQFQNGIRIPDALVPYCGFDIIP
jgi:seryl-tRNA synthetase